MLNESDCATIKDHTMVGFTTTSYLTCRTSLLEGDTASEIWSLACHLQLHTVVFIPSILNLEHLCVQVLRETGANHRRLQVRCIVHPGIVSEPACVWSVAGNWSNQRKPSQAWAEHANFTTRFEPCDFFLWGHSVNHGIGMQDKGTIFSDFWQHIEDVEPLSFNLSFILYAWVHRLWCWVQ